MAAKVPKWIPVIDIRVSISPEIDKFVEDICWNEPPEIIKTICEI